MGTWFGRLVPTALEAAIWQEQNQDSITIHEPSKLCRKTRHLGAIDWAVQGRIDVYASLLFAISVPPALEVWKLDFARGWIQRRPSADVMESAGP